MKSVMSLALVLVAAVCVFFGVVTPLGLASQAKQDRQYYDRFQQAALFADRYKQLHGRSPADDLISKAIIMSPVDDLHSLNPSESTPCGNDFRPASHDKIVLWFWRGEWAECYAFPSRRTTLAMAIVPYLQGWLGMELLLCWLVAIGAGLAAIHLWRLRDMRRADAVA